MFRLNKAASQWLSDAFAMSKDGVSDSQLAARINKSWHPRPDGKSWDEAVFKDPEFRMILADAALSLGPSPIEEPVRRAFSEAGLDHQNPIHWRLLLEFFCYAHFAWTKKVGRPRRRDHAKLLREVAALKQKNHALTTASRFNDHSKEKTFYET
jgi:hypothetical protein